MPRKAKVPAYSLHKASGQAVVRIAGRDRYLGRYGSPESHEHYIRLIAESQAPKTQTSCATAPDTPVDPTVAEVILRYRAFAETHYVDDEGRPTTEFGCLKYAFRPLRELYGSLPARDFGPKSLKAVQATLANSGNYCRREVNKMIQRIVRCFRWAASDELIPPSVYHGLKTVNGLRHGKTAAYERPPIKPVPDAWVDAVLPYAAPPVAAMIRLQRLTGMRPSEVTRVRACDLDMSGEIWVFQPERHKTAWRGQRRQIPIGPRGQEIVRQFLKPQLEAFLFSPQDAEVWRSAQRRLARKTPMTPSQAKRKAKAMPLRPKRTCYDRHSYWRAVEYAIAKANKNRKADAPEIPHWFPLQLRHNKGTDVRKQFGLEAAQVSLGHAHADVTEIYAERNLELAVKIAKLTG